MMKTFFLFGIVFSLAALPLFIYVGYWGSACVAIFDVGMLSFLYKNWDKQ